MNTPTKRIRAVRKVSESPYSKLKHVLTSSIVDNVVGRDDEFRDIFSLIDNALQQLKSLAFYISGPAGTGKSFTVATILKKLQETYTFKLIDINCMHFHNSSNFCEKIIQEYERRSKRKCLKDETIDNFIRMKEMIASHGQMTVLVLDEIDQIQTTNHELLRNIYKLPTLLKDKIILIGIANSLDFTSKITQLKEINNKNFYKMKFLPYTKDQIVAIIENRLKHFIDGENVLIEKSAINYCASKISSCSGDIRKALDVCRRSIELLENNITSTLATNNTNLTPLKLKNIQLETDSSNKIQHVDLRCMMSTLNKVFGTVTDKIDDGPKVFLPSDQQLILCTLLILLKAKSLRQVKLSECRHLLQKICTKKGISSDSKSESEILNMCHLLADYGYVSIINESAPSPTIISPFKKTPRKGGNSNNNKNVTLLSLKLDPSEVEQLLSSFHRSILREADNFL